MKQASSAFVADPKLIQSLEARSTSILCCRNRVLFNQGDAPVSLYIVRKGEATLTMKTPKGEAAMCVRTGAGSILGLPGMLADVPYTLTAEAIEGSELSVISRDDFIALLRSEPLLSLKLLQVLAAEVRAARLSLSAS
jgi:CRP/FNR family cyclic AMP-dependent transcriptional regulator